LETLGAGICALVASACAQISVGEYDEATGTIKGGLEYFQPQPYLLVVDLAPSPKSDQKDAGAQATPNQPQPRTPQQAAGPQTTSSNTPSSSTNTGFTANNQQYFVKLIYLPDLAHPKAVTTTTGIGTVSLGASLQDGWMLTSLQGTSDAKVAETIGAMASLVSAIGGTVPKIAALGGEKLPAYQPAPLPPGLYKFEFNSGSYSLCRTTSFGPTPGTVKECNTKR
jgi:hypothetical protein